ncbi:hypothetical protein TRVA0_029S00166 [Trichomonascus vanleenenianus]|uniref:uncharacterized protein n=1 Tax=Trichomonascus vanleenenianus TaxID=2268995 RepID=UPI003EC98DC9
MSAYDVLIIGAGPCGLAVAARLKEETPSALFTEAEHQRFYWLKNKDINLVKTKARNINKFSDSLSIKVIDAQSSQWLGQWDSQFETCKIPCLRSPMFFHPDPADIDGMISFAYKNNRQNELKEIKGVVGKELSKHQQKRKRKSKPIGVDTRDEKDYYRPSTRLFRDYCEDVVQRYKLADVVSKESCERIEFDEINDIFTITTNCSTYTAYIVVMACGPIGSVNYDGKAFPDGSCHTSHIFSRQVAFPPKKPMGTAIVVGGGLTSAQLCDSLVKSQKASKVYFITRGDIKVKHFDFDLEWVTKYKNYMKSTFWQKDSDEERLEIVRQARNGGSVNPEYFKILHDHQKAGRVEILKYSTIQPSDWDGEKWNSVLVNNQFVIPEAISYIYYATGSTPDVEGIKFLSSICENYPIETIGGLPCLTNDLEWREDVPLYVVGRLAFLRTGPSSANLEGARSGAEWVASSIQKRISSKRKNDEAFRPKSVANLIESGSNWYQILAVEN